MLKGFWWGELRKETTWKNESRWEDNIKTYLQEVGWVINWIYLAQGREK